MLIVHAGDVDLEYRNENETLLDVYYKGVSFTGLLIDDNPNARREDVEYKNGDAHGDYTVFYETGEVESLSTYEYGVCRIEIQYYKTGSVKSEITYSDTSSAYTYYVENIRRWNSQSQLVQDGQFSYYNNGLVKAIKGIKGVDEFNAKFFSRDGGLMYTVKDYYDKGAFVREMKYNYEQMNDNYYESLIIENPELDDETSSFLYHQLCMWIWDVIKVSKEDFLRIINSLLTHPELSVKQWIAGIIASRKLHELITQESAENREIYAFIREYTINEDNQNPDRKPLFEENFY